MALTKEQWYAKLKTWVPGWVFENEDVAAAVFNAIAKVLSVSQQDAEDLKAQTFILTATGSYLDLIGSERSVVRQDGETDDSYRSRIRSAVNTITPVNIKSIVDALLNNGECTLIENQAYGFSDCDFFYDCDDSVYISKRKQYDRFTLLIPTQSVVDDSFLKAIIVQALDESKAAGVFYDIRWGA